MKRTHLKDLRAFGWIAYPKSWGGGCCGTFQLSVEMVWTTAVAEFRVFTASAAEQSESAISGMASMVGSRTRHWLYFKTDSLAPLSGVPITILNQAAKPRPQLSR